MPANRKKTKKINGNFLLTELVELLRWQKFFHLKKLNIWPSSMMMMIIKKSRLKIADSTDFFRNEREILCDGKQDLLKKL